MSENLILGGVTMAVGLAIQCIIVSLLLRLLLHLERKQMISATLVGTASLLSVLMLIMLAGNLVQIALWAGLFVVCGEFEDFATAFYHSVVNFSTLGYGDLVMSQERRLLGALEASNGVLMFGLTTAFLYTILSELMQQAWGRRIGQEAASDGPLPH